MQKPDYRFTKGDRVSVTLKKHDPYASWWNARIIEFIPGNPPRYAVRITSTITLEDSDAIRARGDGVKKPFTYRTFEPCKDITAYEVAMILKAFARLDHIPCTEEAWSQLLHELKRHFKEEFK